METRNSSSNVLSMLQKDKHIKKASTPASAKSSQYSDETAAKLETEKYKRSLNKILEKAEKIDW